MSLQDGKTYLLKNAKTGTYLNAGNGSNDKWIAEATPNGEYRFKNVNGLYLSVAGGPRQGVDICVGRYKQEWRIQSSGNQFTVYYPDTNYALAMWGGRNANGTKIILWTAHGGADQSWIPEPLYTPPPPGDNKPLQNGATYLIRNAKSGTIATVSDENHGAHNHKFHRTVIGWQKTNAISQQWTAEDTGNGEVRLRGPNNLYLGIEGAPKNGALVLLGRYKQQWKPLRQGSAWKFYFPDTNFVLDLDHGSTTNGTKIHLWSWWNGPNQLWQYDLISGGPGTDTPDSDAAGKILKKGEPYKIINVKSSTAAELASDNKWTLEDAGNNRFYIKAYNNAYIGIEGNAERGADVICSSKKQPWSIRVEDAAQKTFKIFFPNTDLAIDLDRGSAASGTTILLWTKWNGPNQQWRFEPLKPLVPFEFNKPYNIVNSKSGTTAELADDNKVVGWKITKGRTSQQWTFESAPNDQVYIKNANRTYLGVDGDVDNGAPCICTTTKQPWDVKADEKDGTKFRINYPGGEFSVELDKGSVSPGTEVLLKYTWEGLEAQKWTFAAVTGGGGGGGETEDHATQYYNDVFFPSSTSGWVPGKPKNNALFYPIPSTARAYKTPIPISYNDRIMISRQTLKELSGQDMWVPGDWRFGTYGGLPGRVRVDDFNLEGGNR